MPNAWKCGFADLLIDNTKDDFTTKMKNGAGIRIVKYAINNKNYYMATTNAQSAYVIFMKTLRVFIKTNLLDAKHFPISFIKVGFAAIMDADGLLKNTSAEGAIC